MSKDDNKTHEIPITKVRDNFAQWVASAAGGDTVVVLQYSKPTAQLVAYTPRLVTEDDDSYATTRQEPPLYPAYYAADYRHPDESRTIADILSRVDRRTAKRLARWASQAEIDAEQDPNQHREEELPRRLVTLEELENLAPVPDSPATYGPPEKPEPIRSPSPPRSTMNSGIKKGR